MKKKYLYYGGIIIAIAVAAYVFIDGSESAEQGYSFSEITKGDVHVTITSTGTLEAMSTVEVGTQVSGKISQIFVDFNDQVRKGQLLAILDTVTLAAQVEDAQANLDKAQAQYNQAVAVHKRNQKLYDKKFISELDFISSETDVEAAKASLKSSESSLEKAKQNLEYAYIYSPISGTIMDRAVEEGQTVAASYSTPTLFTIVNDLTSMRILASVDESDIGSIVEGQKVEFTVQAYSDKTFEGSVTQIRLMPTTSSNVVNYTVVILADNKENFLLPGMTATVDFFVNSSENVLLVPNTALRFSATEAMIAEAMKNMEEDRENMPGSLRGRRPTPEAAAEKSKSIREIWYVDSNSKLRMTPVETGITDGKNTEIIKGRNLKEGMKVITGVLESDSESSSTSTTNALTGQGSRRRMGGGPPPPRGF
ncbi:MAG: efflux RND transporter periplasmic adaptor subunit [Ignavibacteria bacterium]|jgi:HlyD family secretion protein